ncbi:MAG TPA: hypothetical protein DDZ62_00665 [Delftia acidovorans]|nr:hypothetical protein [Delftia acidovorans]
MRDIKNIRKSAIFGIPISILLSVGCFWFSFAETIPMLKDINALAPTIRIMPGAPTIFMTPFVFITLALVSVLNSIPCNDSILRKSDKALSIVFTLGISSALVSLIFITPLQYYAMPKLGYTRCNILEGHPTIYFTDWVKKPEWCVRGKSREWVMEQARLASGPENP